MNNFIPWISVDFEAIQSGPSKQRYTSLIILQEGEGFQNIESYSSPQNALRMAVSKKIEALKKEAKPNAPIDEKTLIEAEGKEEKAFKESSFYKAYSAFYDNNKGGEVLFARIKKDLKEDKLLDEIQKVIDKIKDRPIHAIGLTFFDKGVIDKFSIELDKRWSHTSFHAGFLLAPSIEEKNTFNNKTICLLPLVKKEVNDLEKPDAIVWVSSFLGFISAEGENDPGIPLTSVKIIGLKSSNCFDYDERNKQAKEGFFTWITDPINGDVYIESANTTRIKDENNLEDNTHRPLNKLLTESYLAYDVKNFFGSNYKRYRIAPNGSSFPVEKRVTSPNLLKADLANRITTWERPLALVADSKKIIDAMTITQDIQNKEAVNVNIDHEMLENLIGFNIKLRRV